MKKPLIYLASPYTTVDPDFLARRVEVMELAVATLIRQNLIIPYSPILYTHPIVNLMDNDFDWYTWDLEMLGRCDGMVVVKLPGWETSKGIKIEMNYCFENSIPYVYADFGESIFKCATDILEAIQKKEKQLES